MRAGDMDSFLRNFPGRHASQDETKKLEGAAVVVSDGGDILGMGGVVEIDNENHVWIKIAPRLRKRPIFLYRNLARALSAICAEYAPLHARVDDSDSHRLSTMLGFVETEISNSTHSMVRVA